jgi:hypothetical protein
MTVVLARKYRQRVIIVSDTMVTDTDSKRSLVIPGRLKAIVLDLKFSAAYYGAANQGLDAIRLARAAYLAAGSSEAIQVLIDATAALPNDLEFVTADHCPDPELRHIAQGSASGPLNAVSLGPSWLLRAIEAQEIKCNFPDSGEYGSSEELGFTHAVMEVFHSAGVQVADGVGGLPVCLVCSPYGHHYTSVASAESWYWRRCGFDRLTSDLVGDGWKYTIVPSRLRGAPVLVVFIPQANAAFIYNPIRQDEAIRYDLSPAAPPIPFHEKDQLQVFTRIVDDHAVMEGGKEVSA